MNPILSEIKGPAGDAVGGKFQFHKYIGEPLVLYESSSMYNESYNT